MDLNVSQRWPQDSAARQARVDDDGLTTEQQIIRNGAAVMARERSTKRPEVAEHDMEVDLGNGYSTVYREGDRIAEPHRGLPSKRASLPKTFTLQDDDDEQARGDLAPDRLKGKVVG
jgi:hypothetical protein